MDLQLAFEDEDLESTKRRDDGDCNIPYHVKLCTPEWFNKCDERQDRESSQKYKTLKFSADLSYHRKNFVEAAKQYEAVLDLLPQRNSVVCQDVRECLSRCYMHFGDTDRSVNMARELVSDLSSEDEVKQRQSLLLLSTVCERAGRWHECVEALETYCNLQPYWALSWSRLGDALLHTAQSPPQGEGDAFSSLDSPGMVSRDMIWVKALTCFTRARFLCKLSLNTASDLMKERDQRFIDQMTGRIQSLSLPEEQKEFARTFIPKDTENIFQDNKEDKTNTSIAADLSNQNSSSSFLQRFCSWYDAYHNQETS